VLKRTGFAVTQKRREAYIVQVQALMTKEEGAAAKDLPDGDSGVRRGEVCADAQLHGRRVAAATRRARSARERSASGTATSETPRRSSRCCAPPARRTPMVNAMPMASCGRSTVLYKVIYTDFPADAATWEPAENVASDILDACEAGLEDDAAADASDDDDDDDDEAGGDGDDGVGDEMEVEGDGAASESDGDDDDCEAPQEIASISKHHVHSGSRAGTLYNIYIAVKFVDGSTSRVGYLPSAPLWGHEAGRDILRAYVQSKNGQKIAKYLPAN